VARNMTKLEYFISKGVKILNEMPNGWRVIENATNVPNGYKWINNGKSLFSKDYEHALLKIQ
jgi:hypothetical protein